MVRIDGHIKDIFGSIDNICDDDNIRDVLYLGYLTNAISKSLASIDKIFIV